MKLDYYAWPPARPRETGPVGGGFTPVKVDALQPLRGDHDAASYIPHPDLISAVNVALVLGKPLLVTGDPGTGKTKLAASVAWQLGYPEPLKFVAKSSSVARDLFYTYDALGRFYAAEAAGSRAGVVAPATASGRDAGNVLDFVEYSALGKAILLAHPIAAVEHLLQSRYGGIAHSGVPSRTVVLIDEIDKAPRDFPNDLLDEIDNMQFRVSEYSDRGTPPLQDQAMRPVVIITSNRERQLPDAFMRRCLFFEIPFPKRRDASRPEDRASAKEIAGRYTIEDIVANRVGTGGKSFAASPLATSAFEFLYRLRGRGEPLQKLPATAELIDWLDALRQTGAETGKSLKQQQAVGEATLFTILKAREDQAIGRKDFLDWCAGR